MTEKNQQPVISLQPDMLPISLKEYAVKKGIPLETVRSQAKRGIIPTLRLGNNKTVFVNQALMIIRSLEADGWQVQALPNVDQYQNISN